MDIHIKTSEKFKVHTNRELRDQSGKPMRFYTERDYKSELQKRGLERYDENKHNKRYEPKKYDGISDSAKHMMAQVTYDKKGKPNIGDRYIEKLKSMGVREIPKELRDKQHGGMYGN
jgi:hypothetical protein